jgi:phospholipid/cholesterol/gamma-HCH transport system ATP-binding protein
MIEINGLKKSFGEKVVLDGVDLTIADGKITVIIGRSGGGKSVLLKHVIGLLKPDSGTIKLDGEDITQMSERDFTETLKRFGMLFQGAALFDSMTVAENVGFSLMEHTLLPRSEIRERVAEKLNEVGLKGVEDVMPVDLSGGMKKRVGLARAIIMNPEIVLFDEPTTGLDPIMSDAVAKLILETQKERNTTYFVITHDLVLTEKIADNIAMLHDGRIIEEGTFAELRENPNPILRQFLEGRAEGPIAVN